MVPRLHSEHILEPDSSKYRDIAHDMLQLCRAWRLLTLVCNPFLPTVSVRPPVLAISDSGRRLYVEHVGCYTPMAPRCPSCLEPPQSTRAFSSARKWSCAVKEAPSKKRLREQFLPSSRTTDDALCLLKSRLNFGKELHGAVVWD